MRDTIVAISTALGTGAIGIVRLSGSDSLKIVRQITKKVDFKPRYAHLCKIYEDDELLDEGIVIYFPAPKSYTCEDMCEIQCHGGMILSRAILQLCLKLGARIAMAGEFTKRAFLNGRIDLSQAEAVARLIESQSLKSSKLLVRQLKGGLSDFVESSRKDLIETLASSEVMIDYSEEDIPDDMYQSVLKKIDSLYQKLQQTLEFSQMRAGTLDGIKLCIVGKPNVGKSSLLNALLLEERAIVSDQAGTTRDAIEAQLNIDGNIIKIVDTAGIREADNQIEQIGIERTLKAMKESDVILAVFDLSRIFDDQDEKILSYLQEFQTKDKIFVFNKNDLELRLNRDAFIKLNAHSIELSVSDHLDILKLKELITRIIEKNFSSQDNFLLSSDYQIQAVQKTILALSEAKLCWKNAELEFFSYHIQEAIKMISLLIKPYEIDEMFDEMFSNFCLGK